MNKKFCQKLIIWFVVVLEIASFSQFASLRLLNIGRVQAEEAPIETEEPDEYLYGDFDFNSSDFEHKSSDEIFASAAAAKFASPVTDSLTPDERGRNEQLSTKGLVDLGKLPSSLAKVIENKQVLDDLAQGGGLEKIYFENLIDEFAIFGEPCKVAGLQSWLPLAPEEVQKCNTWIAGEEGSAYDVFPNGVWDGPRFIPELKADPTDSAKTVTVWRGKTSIVDARVVEMLRYLTTPTWQGGAGRERIKIKKIVQFNEKDVEAGNPQAEDPGGEEPEPQRSAHYIGEIRENVPITKTVQAIDIAEIDSVRLTTKITKKRRVGGDSTSYKFQRPFGVKVAWQDDYGLNRAGVPPVDILTGAEDFFRNGLIDLLSDFEITDVIAPGDLADVDLESLTRFVGAEILSQILEAPRGSLEGFDLVDTLEKFGRSVIADQLKLPQQAFASGDSIEEIERNIGQAILEQRFDLPEGAFDGSSSSIMLFNIGRRWLEEEVFQVRPGTLDYAAKDAADEKNKFYPSLGAGRIERAFNFKPGLFDPSKSFTDIKTAGGLRFELVFDKDGKNDAAIDEKLGITVAPDAVVGERPGVAEATKQWRTDQKLTQEYLDLIGNWVFRSSVGTLSQKLPDNAAEAVTGFVLGDGQAKGTDNEEDIPHGGTLMPYGYNVGFGGTWDTQENLNWQSGEGRNVAQLYLDKVNSLKNDVVGSLRIFFNTNTPESNKVKEAFPETVWLKITDPNPSNPLNRIGGGDLRNSPCVYDYQTGKVNSFSTPIWRLRNGQKEDTNLPRCAPLNLTRSDIPGLIRQVSDALPAEIKNITDFQKVIYQGIDRATLEGASEERIKVIEAAEALKQATYQFMEAMHQAQQVGDKTPADQAMALTGSPYLVQAQVKNPDGQSYSDNSLVTKLQEGNRDVFGTIGMIKLAQKTSDNTEEQATIQVNLFEKTQSFFDNLTGAANQFGLGLSEPRIRGRFGLLDGDYDKLFLQNLGQEVFERIGKVELLASVWNHPEFQEEVQRVRQNPTYQEIEQVATEANQELDFYLSRLNQIKSIIERDLISGFASLSAQVEAGINVHIKELYPGEVKRRREAVPPEPELTLDQAGRELTDRFKLSSFSSVGAALEFLSGTSIDLGIIYEAVETARIKGVGNANTLYQKAITVRHLAEEMVVGRALPLDRPENLRVEPLDQNYSLPAVQQKTAKCWSSSQLINILKPAGEIDVSDSLKKGLQVVGACELDKKLTLPIGSLYDFYQTDEHSLKNFILSIGRASYREKNQAAPVDEAALDTEGRRVLTTRVIQRLALQSGAFRDLTKKYPLTEETIFQLIMGNEGEAAITFGGSLIDSRLHLTPGTTAELVDPCRAEEIMANRGNTKCENLSAKEREEIRTQVFAREGLRQLGFELDIPWGVDFTQGNFRDNLGKNQFETILGITGFYGDSIDEVIARNGTSRFLAGIGAPPTPYANLLVNLKFKVKEELDKINPSDTEKKVDLQVVLGELDNLHRKEEKAILESLKRPDQPFYYWWPVNNNEPFETIRDRLGDNVLAEQQKLEEINSDIYNLFPAAAKTIFDQAKNNLFLPNGGSGEKLANQMTNNAFLFKWRVQAMERRINGANELVDSYNGDEIDRPVDYGYVRILDVVQGKISPEALNKQAGDYALWNMGVQLLGTKYKDTFIGSVINDYNQFASIMGNVPSLASIFSGQSGDFDWGQMGEAILKDESNDNARAWLFDRFFSRMFSNKFDEQMGFEHGTMRQLLVRPYLARQIMIDQGMTILANELFRSDQGDSEEVRQGKFALVQVFNAGFMVSCNDQENADKDLCKTGRDYYTLDFQKQRAIGKFRELVVARLEGIIAKEVTPVLGTSIPLSDFNGLMHGDLRTLGFIASAYTITQVNKKDDKALEPRERRVDYSVGRLATIGSPNAPAVIAAGEQAAVTYRQDLNNTYCSQDIPCADDREIIQAMATKTNTSTEQAEVQFNSGKKSAVRSAQNRANSQIRDQAMKSFQYQMMDAALYKIDVNFPLGFAESFFSSGASPELKNDALLLFGFNKLSSNDSGWKTFLSGFGQNGRLNLSAVRNFRLSLDLLSCQNPPVQGEACRKQFFSTIYGTDALHNFAEAAFGDWFKDIFGADLKYGAEGLFDGLMSFGYSGKIDGHLTEIKDGKEIQVTSLLDVAEDWASTRIFMWADRSLGFDIGVSAQIYDAGYQLYDAYKNYDFIKSHSAFEVGMSELKNAPPLDPSKDFNEQVESLGETAKNNNAAKLKEAQAQFITFAVTTIFKSQIASMENKLGLVPGTGAMAVGMLINLIVGVPIDPITIALFIGLNLFGYYKIITKVQGTADGYYPFVGAYGDFTMGGVEVETNAMDTRDGRRIIVTQQRRVNFQYPSPDPPIGEFDAKNGATYRDGLKKAAKAKIEGLLIDLATAPERWKEAKVNHYQSESYTLMPSQVFTKLPEHIDAVQGFISRPPCRSQTALEQNGGCGYGPVDRRRYSGFWANQNPDDVSFWDHLHVAW